MTKTILVTYASKTGATTGIASRIAEIMRKYDLSVDLIPVKEVKRVDAYDAVVLGSSIRAGQLLPEATTFIDTNLPALQALPVSMFISCMTLETDNTENRQTVSTYLDPVRAKLKLANEGMFAGCMDIKKLNFLFKMMMKAMKTPEGDYRDWEEIEGWAKDVALSL